MSVVPGPQFEKTTLDKERRRVMMSPSCLPKALPLREVLVLPLGNDTRNDQAFQGRSHFLIGVWPSPSRLNLLELYMPRYSTCIPIRGTHAQSRARISFLPFLWDSESLGLGGGVDWYCLTLLGRDS